MSGLKKELSLNEIEMDVIVGLIPKNLPSWLPEWKKKVIRQVEERIYKELSE